MQHNDLSRSQRSSASLRWGNVRFFFLCAPSLGCKQQFLGLGQCRQSKISRYHVLLVFIDSAFLFAARIVSAHSPVFAIVTLLRMGPKLAVDPLPTTTHCVPVFDESLQFFHLPYAFRFFVCFGFAL